MTEIVSQTDPKLIIIDALADFQKHAQQVIEKSKREILLLSTNLDPELFDQNVYADMLVDFVRRDRNSTVKILVKDIRPLIESGHCLLNLARRVSSKVEIRKLLKEPEDENHAFLMGDRKFLLYKHDDKNYQGFVNYNAAPESRSLADEFVYLWEQHSVLDPSLKTFVL
jgi:hypothetical protein